MPRWETLRETTVEVAAGTPHAAQQPEKRCISVSPFSTGRVPLFQRGEKIIRIIHHNEGSNVLWVDKSRVAHALEGVHEGGPETVNVVEHNRPGNLTQLLEGEYFTEFFQGPHSTRKGYVGVGESIRVLRWAMVSTTSSSVRPG